MDIEPPPFRVNQYRLFMCIETTNNSTVYLASKPPSSQKIILKFIPLNGKIPIERIDNECTLQCEIQHSYIMPINDFFDFQQYRVIVMPRANGGTIVNALAENVITSITCICKIMYRTLHSIFYLHQLSILHGDIKPSNIVLMDTNSEEPQPRLIDFGHAVRLRESEYCNCNLMTCSYSAPEVLLRQPHSFPSDIWSLGATFYFLVTGQSVLHLKDLDLMARDAMNLNLTFESGFGPAFPESGRSLIRMMMHHDPSMRPIAEYCIQNPLFIETIGYEWVEAEGGSILRSDIFTSFSQDEDEMLY
ncbi:AGC family protein kinase [Tritrichomonas foetus]|uniref:AGC family protein kinase n=1 Tax=Tritrichomonas foetus TaxID=1144522 RepID=A0A1J4K1W5_9EUKA|nr:AGC family protein kinase [Tritrichomonas foetus]|eukprot:OHT03732.1 AGC family protein kinase [Tritrichomonas foetus]